MNSSNEKRSREATEESRPALFRVRTVTAFVTLGPNSFPLNDSSPLLNSHVHKVITEACSKILVPTQEALEHAGYEVQTVRLATNPFEEWLSSDNLKDLASIKKRLAILDSLLIANKIEFCALGPSRSLEGTKVICPIIVASSPRFSCSADINAIEDATAAAECILTLARLGEKKKAPPFLKGGLGNFRFCATCSCVDHIPFFPAARSPTRRSYSSDTNAPLGFAVGLENGKLAQKLLETCKSVGNIHDKFRSAMAAALLPVQHLCLRVAKETKGVEFLGLDTSLNPSLDKGGSVVEAIEKLTEVRGNFGLSGTLAAAAAITTALQSLPGIRTQGYCGLMLPVCEDLRLAELASLPDERGKRLKISNLLSISSVCGVGVDTVPLPGDSSVEDISSLILDVAGLASRWNKSLSCRVFPVPDKKENDMAEFDSPFLSSCRVFKLP